MTLHVSAAVKGVYRFWFGWSMGMKRRQTLSRDAVPVSLYLVL